MKNIILIPKKRIIASLIIIFIFISVFIYIIVYHDTNKETINVSNIEGDTIIETLKKENYKLKGMLDSIVPEDNKILYEGQYRYYKYYIPDYETYDLSIIIDIGLDINFDLTYDNPDYMRPVYDSSWKDFYFRSWLNLSHHMDNAYHNLFIYYGGASTIFDFEGVLGFHENINVDYHHNINFLVYNFHVNQVKMYENQIVLIGIPLRKGAQIISLKVNDILPVNIDRKKFLFQLSTPSGYETDYLYGYYYRSQYLKDEMEKEKIEPTYADQDTMSTILELREENALLKHELSKYIPLKNNVVLTKQKCRNTTNLSNSKKANTHMDISEENEVPFAFKYINDDYKRPVYDPIWKEKYEEGLCYMPTKICEGLHNLFVLPEDPENRLTFLERLGFHEEHTIIEKNETSFLIYKFIPDKIIILDNELLIIGVPNRTGAHLIAIDNSKLTDTINLVKLVTPTLLELDYEALK